MSSDMNENKPDEKGPYGQEQERFGWKDVLAFSIALFQVLAPIAALIIIAYAVVLLIISHFWLGG